jgi:hypothetical protein
MEKVLFFAPVSVNTLDYMLFTKLTLVQQKVLSGVNQSLKEIK